MQLWLFEMFLDVILLFFYFLYDIFFEREAWIQLI